jgi:hypothetical protein
MKAIKQLSLFWAAVNEPPPYTESNGVKNGRVTFTGKEEVKNGILSPHPALGG